MGNCIELHTMISCLNESTYICVMSGRTEIMSGYVRNIKDLDQLRRAYQILKLWELIDFRKEGAR